MKDLKHKIKKFIENEKYQGIEWIIQNKDNVYFDRVGYLDLESKTPFPENTIYRIWSMTKPIISIVILQMIKEKKINLNDPINLYLPIFTSDFLIKLVFKKFIFIICINLSNLMGKFSKTKLLFKSVDFAEQTIK